MSADVTPIQSTSAKGQVTIPIAIRRKLGIEEGTKIRFVERNGQIVLEKVIPMALKKAKPGTAEFRAALKDAMETMGRTVFAHGVMNWTPTNHWGYTMETGVMQKVVDGKFAVEK